MTRRPGTTLLEMLVGMSILSVLMMVILLVYVTGANAWAKGDAQASLLQSMQVATTRIAGDLEKSAYNALAIETYDVSCLSSTTPEYTVAADSQGRVQWNHYLTYYRDASQNTLLRSEVSLNPGDPQVTTPAPLTSYAGGGGPHPLAYYCTGGSVVARYITGLQFAATGRLVRLTVDAEMMRYGRQDPEHLQQVVTARVRN